MSELLKPATALRAFFKQISAAEVRSMLSSGIYQKGRNYYQDGAVGEVEITREGRDEYTVELFEKNDGVYGKCSCPYGRERGGPCKRIAAVLLHLRDEPPEGTGRLPEVVAHLEKTKPKEDELLRPLHSNEAAQFYARHAAQYPNEAKRCFSRILAANLPYPSSPNYDNVVEALRLLKPLLADADFRAQVTDIRANYSHNLGGSEDSQKLSWARLNQTVFSCLFGASSLVQVGFPA